MTEGNTVFVKCAWRLLPLLMLIYGINLLDRNNVAFAALGMNKDLGLSATIYGLGAGIIFVGFVLCQIPSTLMLEKVGARRWLCFIMVVWGILASACALVRGPASFCTLRFLLGFAEAGVLPGLVLYLSTWFPKSMRARFTAILMIAVPLAKIFGGMLSGSILGMDGIGGIAGWRWLFVLEGAPAILLGLVTFRLLPDGPHCAPWLSGEEKQAVAARLAAEDVAEHSDFRRAMRDPRVYVLGLVTFCILLGNDSLTFWLPQIIKGMGFTNLETGFVAAIPSLAGIAATIVWSRSSDRRGERVWHAALAAVFAAMGFALAATGQSNLLVLAGLTFAIMGITAKDGPLFSIAPTFLSGPAAAGSIALIYAMGSVAGLVGPLVTGIIKDHTGGYAASMVMYSGAQVMAALLILSLGRAFAPRALLCERGAI